MRGGDPLGRDEAGEVAGVLVPARLCHDQRGTRDQRPEELPDRHVEAGRGFLHDAVAGLQVVLRLHPEQTVDDRPVGDDDALGPAGGSGGVDDVRGMVGPRRREQPSDVLLFVRAPVSLRRVRCVEDEDRRISRRQVGRDRAAGQHDGGCGVGEHEADPLGGIVRVQRKIGRPRPVRRQQRHHEVDRAR